MTDDVRRAAERIKREAGESLEDIYGDDRIGGFTPAECLAADYHAVADAYLAEHPADDGEPVTTEWLAAAGFAPQECPKYLPPPLRVPTWKLAGDEIVLVVRVGPTERYLDWGQLWDLEEVDGDDSVHLLPLPTRGHVRRLAAALAIPIGA